jgi:two-component system chemotaxis response regulator CheB
MNKIKVLITDDSIAIRQVLKETLSKDPEIEVVGTAANGRICLEKLPSLSPHIVILDVEMPEMNGLETMELIGKKYPKLPVIMFSTLTMRGAHATLDALASGARDYVTKPSSSNLEESIKAIQRDLIPKVKIFGRQSIQLATQALPTLKTSPSTIKLATPRSPKRIELVAIGVSTGGPNALAVLFPALANPFPVPIVLVQHMPPVFTQLLAERLGVISKMKVVEAKEGMILEANTAYIAPGDFHMVLEPKLGRMQVKLNQEERENSCRPAVDVLFRSVAKYYADRSLAVILTGMGQDGLVGCQDIAKVGGTILAQDEASSVVWGMPGFIAREGLAEKVVPLDEMGQEISRRLGCLKTLTSSM